MATAFRKPAAVGRTAPLPINTPLRLARMVGSDLACHVLSTDGDTVTVITEGRRVLETFPASECVRLLPDVLPCIPRTAFVAKQPHAELTEPTMAPMDCAAELDFYSFEMTSKLTPLGIVNPLAALFVRLSLPAATDTCTLLRDELRQKAAISEALGDALEHVTSFYSERAAAVQLHGAASEPTARAVYPWTQFWSCPGSGTHPADDSQPVWLLHFASATAKDVVPVAAARLMCAAFVVSAACKQAGTSAQLVRAQSFSLKPCTDSTILRAVTAARNALPGMLCLPPACRPWAMYDDDFQIQRSMLHWAMLGAVAATSCTDIPATHLCEPLASYVAVYRATFPGASCPAEAVDGDDDDCAAKDCSDSGAKKPGSQQHYLQFTAPCPLSEDQCTQVLTLFYWAAIHRDASSSPVDASMRRVALEFYAAMGHITLRKRAYEFHSTVGSSNSSVNISNNAPRKTRRGEKRRLAV